MILTTNYSDFDIAERVVKMRAIAEKKGVKTYMRHEDVCKQLTETYYKKNHDYGDSFSRGYEEFGLISCLVRISDKYNRLVNLIKSGNKAQVNDESVADTLLDMANYCILTYMELNNNKEKGTEKDGKNVN